MSARVERPVLRAYLVTAALTGINLSISVGFTIATLAGGAPAASWYTLVRAVALLGVLVVVLVRRSVWGLILIAATAGAVQAADALIAVAVHDTTNIAGPAVIGVLTIASVAWLAAPSRHRS